MCSIVDESTTISHKTIIVICLKAVIASNEEVIKFFLDIVELQNTTAKIIQTNIINNLSKYGLTSDYLQHNLMGFVSDGALNILVRISGVGIRLQRLYPNIIVWHCCNYRLELAVSDTLKEVQGINHFNIL